jgi:hypothetical protein
VWHWIGLGLLAAFVFAALGVASLFWLDRDARTVRDHLLAGLHVSPKIRVQLDLGWGSLTVARLVTRCVPKVPEEARAGLSAVRAVGFGVYQLDEPVATTPAALTALDEKMARRGWTRTVLVRNPKETVVVYTKTDGGENGALRACVAVINARECVVVSARGEVTPLLDLARRHLADKSPRAHGLVRSLAKGPARRMGVSASEEVSRRQID